MYKYTEVTSFLAFSFCIATVHCVTMLNMFCQVADLIELYRYHSLHQIIGYFRIENVSKGSNCTVSLKNGPLYLQFGCFEVICWLFNHIVF